MEFQAFLSTNAVEDVHRHTFGVKCDGEANNRWRFACSSGVMCYIAIHELVRLDLHLKIILGNEVTSEILSKYEQHVLRNILPAKQKAKVAEVVCDRPAKVHIKCSSSHTHADQPGNDESSKPCGHGWFMIVNLTDTRISWAKPMPKLEGNEMQGILHHRQGNARLPKNGCLPSSSLRYTV